MTEVPESKRTQRKAPESKQTQTEAPESKQIQTEAPGGGMGFALAMEEWP